tara:strand:+ start:9327 stop:9845 length:519 start_codon:yes stop_codon:yes gene_type:complete
MNRIFLTGVPGSRWSGIAQELESEGGYNISDRTPERTYTHKGNHVGAYFGTGMEFPAILDTKNLDLPYRGTGTKLHKSHEWSLMLDDITDLYHRSGIILIYRPNEASLEWWLQAGGFNITYPNYDYYKDEKTMAKHIAIQNDAILKFAHKHKLMWEHHYKHHDILIAKKFPK